MRKGATVWLDAAKALKELAEYPGRAEKAVKATMSDVRTRGPAAVSKAVMEEYNIGRKEIKETLSIKGGATLGDMAFIYRGRRLTPVHFGMKPKVRPSWARGRLPKGVEYPITMEVKRGRRVSIVRARTGRGYSKSFLARARASDFKRNGQRMPSIAWMRKPGKAGRPVGRLPIEPFKTIAVPQMVQDGKGQTKPFVRKALDEVIQKRLMHNLERFL